VSQQRYHWYGVDASWGALNGDAHWRHLANTIEPCTCGGDAAQCQIASTTCYGYCLLLRFTNNVQQMLQTDVKSGKKTLFGYRKQYSNALFNI